MPFLERSVKLAEEAFQLWNPQQQGKRSAGTEGEEEWKTFEEQLPGRWSTLGACFGKIGERKVSKRLVYEQMTMS